MKPNVLLAGGSGFLGKQVSAAIENDASLYALSKYPKPEETDIENITWLKKDIYNYKDVLNAMEGMDIAIFYIDPNKNSAKLTKATAKDLNLIAADNFGRAAAKANVKEIIYISGSRLDKETVERLAAYGVKVRQTEQIVKRPHINVELQVSKYDDVRQAMRIILPKKWTLNQLVEYFFEWLNKTKGTFVHTDKNKENYIIYSKNLNKPLFILKKCNKESDIITLHMIGGKLTKFNSKTQGKIEFRRLKGTSIVIVHLFDYIPRLFWPIYYFVQSPLQGLIMRGFEIDCRINHFQKRMQDGEQMKYTK